MLTEDKFISKLHLRQPGFTCSDCGPFIEHCEEIEKFREADNLKNYIGMMLLLMQHILIVEI